MARPLGLPVFISAFVLPAHDVFQGAGDVRLGQILDPPAAQQGDDVALDTAYVGDDGAGLLRTISLAEDEALVEVGEVAVAELLHGHGLVIELALLGGVSAVGHLTQQRLRLAASRFRRPDAVQADGEAPRAARRTVLDDVASLAGGEYPKAEAGQILVPNDVVFGLDLGHIYGAFCELRHVNPPSGKRLA